MNCNLLCQHEESASGGGHSLLDDVLDQEATLEVAIISADREAIGLHSGDEVFVGPSSVFAAEREEDVEELVLVQVVFLDALQKTAHPSGVQPNLDLSLVLQVEDRCCQSHEQEHWKKMSCCCLVS
ncbi:unnamed protein product [Ixodes pacificus]